MQSTNIIIHLFFLVSLNTFATSTSIINHDFNKNTVFQFRGLMAPVFTPFNDDADRTLNLSIISEYAKFLASKNITGILVGGTTGEGTSLSINEKKELIKAWADAVKETGQHLMVQVGGAALIDVKELAAYAESLNVDSLLCLPDLYFKPTKAEDLSEYLKNVADAAPNTPLLYYQSTKANVNVKPEDILKFVDSKIPTLTGIKLDSSDIRQGINALAVNDKFTVIYGSKMAILAGCVIGVDTFMAATLNFIPEYSFKIMDFCYGRSDLKTAKNDHNILSKIENEILKYGGYVETMKTTMSLVTGLHMGPTRAPLKQLSRENVEAMQIGLSNLGLNINKSIQ